MKKTMLNTALFALFSLSPVVQATDAESVGVKFTGYIKTDLMYDTRQTESLREGHFLLFPLNESKDVKGNDMNACAQFNILPIQTRLTGTITGPSAFGAQTSGLIEGSFFGNSNSDINGFRLRHAMINLKWSTSSFMVGQFWHPMFVTEVAPGTISFNTGAPFQPFSRNPQIRFSQTINNWQVIAAAISQRDFASNGPLGASSVYLRNAVIPNMHLQLQFKSTHTILGIGGDWKSLKPRLQTEKQVKTSETISSMSFIGYAKLTAKKVTWKMEGILGENMTDHLMLGGYAVQNTEAETGAETYVTTDIISFWTDISHSGTVSVGCFAGFTQNRGAKEPINGKIYGRGDNIDHIYRIAPRLVITSGKTQMAAELEHTAAAYGTINRNGRVKDTKTLANTRLLLAAYYYF